MNKFYTGIGSRDIPPEEQHKCTIIAKHLSYADYTLRSGASKGADTAFENATKALEEAYQLFEIYKSIYINNIGYIYIHADGSIIKERVER